MEQWQRALASIITNPEELASRFFIDPKPLKEVVEWYPMRITPYYLDLLREPGDPIWRQCVPDPAELRNDNLFTDPLNEEGLSPVPGLIHRYPDRVVVLVSSSCATFCRFCMRKHHKNRNIVLSLSNLIEASLKYIEKTEAIRDVILSGGDPLLLCDDVLEDMIVRLHRIPHLKIVRIHTRVPVTLPNRVTSRLSRMLKKYHPLYINTHFNHPLEITPQSAEACARLAEAGIPLGNQTVLLKGVNDDLRTMKELVQKLLSIRVRPYYIHQMDLVKGTSHFRTPVTQGLEIMSGLQGHTSGLAIPHYVIDLPGGKGKVRIQPDCMNRQEKVIFLRNYLGETFEYQDVE